MVLYDRLPGNQRYGTGPITPDLLAAYVAALRTLVPGEQGGCGAREGLPAAPLLRSSAARSRLPHAACVRPLATAARTHALHPLLLTSCLAGSIVAYAQHYDDGDWKGKDGREGCGE